MAQRSGSICILPRVEGLGGPASFTANLMAGLKERQIVVHHDPFAADCAAILVIGGTRQLDVLWRAKQRGVRIVQRLNGMNWIHRKRRTGLKHYLRAEVNNWILTTIRRWLADRIVYQSRFASDWWATAHKTVPAPGKVIYNSVDLMAFLPVGAQQRPEDRWRVQVLEARMRGGYEQGLETAIALTRHLAQMAPRPVELNVVGDVPPELKTWAEGQAAGLVRWGGVAGRGQIAEIDRSAHVLFSADLNAACPNSVIEALACGLPVVAYATGALPELLDENSGLVVPWGGNYWNLEPPDVPALAQATLQILQEQDRFRRGARARAEAVFGREPMIDRYLEVLLG